MRQDVAPTANRHLLFWEILFRDHRIATGLLGRNKLIFGMFYQTGQRLARRLDWVAHRG